MPTLCHIYKTIHQGQKAIENNVLQELSSRIDCTRNDTANKRLPHGFVNNMIDETKLVCPWLTYNKLMNYNRYQAKKNKLKEASDTNNRCVLVYYRHIECL